MINSKRIISTLEKEKANLKKLGVKKIGLFGSFAKGKQKEKSDIDILVNFDKITSDNFFDLMETLEKLFKRKIDLVIEKNLVPELNYVKKEAQYVKL